MSVWASTWGASDLDGDDVRAPIRYADSTVLPADDDTRGGVVEVSEIPGHIERPGRPAVDVDFGSRVHPWLRMGVMAREQDYVVLVLDHQQVTSLHAYLGSWLQRSVAASDADPGVSGG